MRVAGFQVIVPLPFFGREPRLASLMIEVNRKLYMDEGTGERLPSYAAVKAALGDALKTIASYWSESGNS